MTYDENYDPLCCCEYFDRNNERNHILACCCNCFDFDQVCENLICCRPTNRTQTTSMFITFQDRLRIPWRGGAKNISCEGILPILLVSSLIFLAAINEFLTYFSLGMCCGILFLAKRIILKRSKFFIVWFIWSVILNVIVFEQTIPLYEVLFIENVILIILMAGAVILFHKTKQISNKQIYCQESSSTTDETVILIAENENDTNNKQTKRENHHNYNCWIDSNITEQNQYHFIFALGFAFAAFLMYANLSLTAICHPVLIFNLFGITILLPDDCADVYDLYEIALGYVTAGYSLVLAIGVTYYLVKQMSVILSSKYWGRTTKN